MQYDDFPYRLKVARRLAGFSQKDLAESVGTTNNSISNYESGIREPDFSMLINIADALSCTTDFLLGRSDEPWVGCPVKTRSGIELPHKEIKPYTAPDPDAPGESISYPDVLGLVDKDTLAQAVHDALVQMFANIKKD